MIGAMGRIVRGQNTFVPSTTLSVAVSHQPALRKVGLDISALLLDGDGWVRGDADLVFHGQPAHPSGAVRIVESAGPDGSGAAGTDGDGAGERAEYRITVDLTSVEPEIARVVVAGSTEGGTVGELTDPVLEAYAPDGESVVRYAVTEADTETAFVFGEFYRRAGGWKFRAVGQGYETGLEGLVTEHGIEVSDEDPPEPAPDEIRAPVELLEVQKQEQRYGQGPELRPQEQQRRPQDGAAPTAPFPEPATAGSFQPLAPAAPSPPRPPITPWPAQRPAPVPMAATLASEAPTPAPPLPTPAPAYTLVTPVSASALSTAVPAPVSVAHPAPGKWSLETVFQPYRVQRKDDGILTTDASVPPGPVIAELRLKGGDTHADVDVLKRSNRPGSSLFYKSSYDEATRYEARLPVTVPRDRPLRLRVRTREEWDLRILPLAAAPRLQGTISGTCPEALLHTGGPGKVRFLFRGDHLDVRGYAVDSTRGALGDSQGLYYTSRKIGWVTLRVPEGPYLFCVHSVRGSWRLKYVPGR